MLTKLVRALACCALTLAARMRAEDVPPSRAPSPEAQSVLRVGARVRLNEGQRTMKALTGRVLSVDDERLLLEVSEGEKPLEVRRADIHGLEISVGHRRAGSRGALIGALSLGIPGTLLGAAAGRFSDAECSGHCGSSAVAPSAVLMGAVAGGIGAGLGALIGNAFTIDDWQAVEQKRVSAYVVPTRRGVAASVSFKF